MLGSLFGSVSVFQQERPWSFSCFNSDKNLDTTNWKDLA